MDKLTFGIQGRTGALALASTLAIAIAGVLGTSPARAESPANAIKAPDGAQEVPSASDSAQAAKPDRTKAAKLDAVSVTAERREQSLQDTPISVTAITAEDLRRANVRDISDLSGTTPGLIVGGKLTGGGNQPITIRGVTGQVVLTGADPAVSVYLDGVYLSKPDAAFFTLADVERVEVLRGPQGTLYGRNATAGAINIITRAPDSTKWQGTFDANYGNYNGYDARGYLGGPLGGGFTASLSLATNGNDGYIRNTANGKRENSIDSSTGRVKLLYTSPEGAFDAALAYDKTREKSDPAFFQYAYGPLSNPTYVGVSKPGETFVDWADYNDGLTVSDGTSLTLNYYPSDHWTITSITGRRELQVDQQYSITPEGGFPPLGGLGIQSINHSDYGPSISQELHAVYQRERLNVTTGVAYFDEDVSSQFGGVVAPLNSPPGDLNKVATAPVVSTTAKSIGVFAQADWEFYDRWTATLGLRANREKRDMHEDFPAIPTHPTLDSHVKDDHLIPKIGISYRQNSALMFYGSISDGYQAPGQSYSSSAAGRILEVAPEKLRSYEVGMRSEWLDSRLRLNLTAFHYDYDPLQVRVTVGLNQFNIVNAIAKVDGFEMEMAAAVTDELNVYANMTLLDGRYTDFCDSPVPFDGPGNCTLPGTTVANNGVSRDGNALNQAPKQQFNIGFNYVYPLSVWDASVKLDASYSYQSDYYSGPANINPYLRSQALGRLNMRAALAYKNGLELYIFGRNINDAYSEGAIQYTALVGNILAAGMITAPRTYGVGVHYSF